MQKLKIFFLIVLLSPALRCDTLKILFLGDTYFGESYSKYTGGVSVIDEYGYDHFFENVSGLLSQSDFTIANFEAPLCENKNTISSKPYLHWCDVSHTVKYLNKYGIDAVSLGNNHAMDMGEEGLIESLHNFTYGGISYFGAGLNNEEAIAPFRKKFNINDKEFELAVISGFEYRPSYDTLYRFYAGDGKAGVNKLEVNALVNEIRELKAENPDIFIVFFPHWGKNYKQEMGYQQEMAYKLIDAGCDLVIGQGSHTVQQAEYYHSKWIFYNIGNFIFNAPGRYRSTKAKPYSLMVQLEISESGKEVKLYPVYCDNLKCDYMVRMLDEDEFTDCIKMINPEKNRLLSTDAGGFIKITLQ